MRKVDSPVLPDAPGAERASGPTEDEGSGMRHSAETSAPPVWWKRENLIAGAILLLVTALAWVYTLHVGSMDGMSMPAGAEAAVPMMPDQSTRWGADLLLFLFGWAVMMVAMMLPAALPLVLLYGAIARKQRSAPRVTGGIAALLGGYFVVWTLAGLPVFGYNQWMAGQGPGSAVLPAILLVAGGFYQFTNLKHGCHSRCSSPLFFLTRHWRPGMAGAARLGALHGVDCLGCCVGLMLALVGLGMMNVAWMLTAAVIILVEKTLPWGHRLARPLGVVLIIAGVVMLASSLGMARGM